MTKEPAFSRVDSALTPTPEPWAFPQPPVRLDRADALEVRTDAVERISCEDGEAGFRAAMRRKFGPCANPHCGHAINHDIDGSPCPAPLASAVCGC